MLKNCCNYIFGSEQNCSSNDLNLYLLMLNPDIEVHAV